MHIPQHEFSNLFTAWPKAVVIQLQSTAPACSHNLQRKVTSNPCAHIKLPCVHTYQAPTLPSAAQCLTLRPQWLHLIKRFLPVAL